MKIREHKKKRKPIATAIRWTLLVLLVAVLVVSAYFGAKLLKIKSEAEGLVDAKGAAAFREGLTTLVYDNNGGKIAALSGEKDSYYLEFKDIPYMVREIFIVTEDRSFYEHSGVDCKSVLRAFIALVQNDGEITQGGSTITQQLARNVYLTYEVSWERKLKEMFIARKLEDIYSKDELLEFYINDIYFANGLYGIQAAAKGYFNKDVSELSLSQLCFICSIPNNPEAYNPLENKDAAIARRDRILKQLLEEKVISRSDYEGAVEEEINLLLSEKIKNNYVETFVKYSATRALMEVNGFEFKYFFDSNDEKEAYTEEYNRVYSSCNSMLFTEGYRIYTSIDMEKQRLLQEALDKQLLVDKSVNENGVYNLQGSGVCVDNSTGYVVAAVGGREQETEGYTLNRSYQSFRQPGSSIKPILIYTPLFEREYTPDSIVVDERLEGGPVNSPNVYGGNITVRTALALSKNTIAWKLFDLIGYNKCISYLLNMQFSHIVKQDYVPAMSIGGMTYGVSALEMASAYGAIANDGIYRSPTCIVKITDSFGNVVVDNSDNSKSEKKIYDKNAALMTTDVLKDVLSWGTGKAYQVETAVCAGKTGTTNDNKDTWFAGYSKYYTTAVWCGYDMPKTIEGDAVKSAGLIWHNYMEEIHRGVERQDFADYEAATDEKNEVKPDTEESEETKETPDVSDQTTDNEAGINQNETPYIPETSDGDGIYVEPY